MATNKLSEDDASLPFQALQLLAPPLRLVSAAVWKVMRQRDALQYGVVEEFIRSACESVPGLLTVRHQGKLTLGLRARFILELCSTQTDPKVVESHLERIRTPSSDSSSGPTAVKDVKVKKAAKKFKLLVDVLLTNPAKREQFFKEEFPVDYGPVFDQELEKLLWEFLIRLDQLLPVPNLAQTVSWLSSAPSVLEECAHAATQPQLLKTLLEHQRCLGHLEPAGSIPPNMGDSILDSLSLPLSGAIASDRSTDAKTAALDQSGRAPARDDRPFITPVIGLISNEDVPVMSASTRNVSHASNTLMDPKENFVNKKQMTKADVEEDGEEQLQEETETSKRTIRRKRKHPYHTQSDSDEEELQRFGLTQFEKKRNNRGDQRTGKKNTRKTVQSEQCDTEALATCLSKLGVKALPEDPTLCSVYLSCLSSRPKVVLENLPVASVGAQPTGSRGKRSDKEQQDERRSPVEPAAQTSTITQHSNQDPDFRDLDDKENRPLPPGMSSSPSRQQNPETAASQGEDEDYIADSEDEVTKNFKGRLFMKRYYKTKHGTYVPTLREFWKPALTRGKLLSVGNKRR